MRAMAIMLAAWAMGAGMARAGVEVERDTGAGRVRIVIDGREALVFQHGEAVDIAHFYPVRSPSGKSMTVQQVEPYPHHRSFYVADSVELAGKRRASFYNALYSRKPAGSAGAAFRERIRLAEMKVEGSGSPSAVVSMKLVWEMDEGTGVLDEQRTMRIVALGEGEYFIDLAFTVTAAYGDVKFASDAVHYAWPFIRMAPVYAPEKDGTLSSSAGGSGQAQTHGKRARWVDYSGTVEGTTEGLAMFVPVESGDGPAWLTRDYGIFGPRREDAQSGKPFTLKNGESLKQRVGVLVHKGDVASGKVVARYAAYLDGTLTAGK